MRKRATDLVPGDIFTLLFGVKNRPERALLIDAHDYPTGERSIRWRYADNPRGVDWRGFFEAGEDVEYLGHDETADTGHRSLLPSK